MQLIENSPHFWSRYAHGKHGAAHKYHYGHVLLYGGWPSFGASLLAGEAVLRAGGGLLSVAVPNDLAAQAALTRLPEAIIEPTPRGGGKWRDLLAQRQRNVALIGPGAGQDSPQKVRAFLEAGLQHKGHDSVTVVDGDALTLLAGALKTLKAQLHPRTILTPHEGEFDRLFPDGGENKQVRTAQAARTLNAIIIHKGAETVIAHPDGRVVISPAANPWLATAGSGDVLAGLVAGLVGWRVAPENPALNTALNTAPDLLESAAAACYLHGLAAHMAGPGLIASDLLRCLPAAWAAVTR